MEEHFAIKRSDALLWTGKLTREELSARLDKGQLTHDWLICPFGSARYAVTLDQFIDDPAIFRRLRQKDVERENHRRSIVASVEDPWLLSIGRKLFKWFLCCLVVGGSIVRIFFPQMIGGEFTPAALMVLVPVWSIGGIGVLAVILGSLQHKIRVSAALKQQVACPTDT